MVTAAVNYGLVQRGHDYVLIDEGLDWYRIKVKGKSIAVFKWVFEA
jgi:hypothetical protein